MYCVYKHTCPNGKVYIGLTKDNPIKRWANGKGYKHNVYFTNAILKYGWDNIRHEIVFDGLTKTEAEEIEVELIKKYNSNNNKYGYNLSKGGEFGRFGCCCSEENKRKLSETRKGKNNPMFNHIYTLEERQRRSKAMKQAYTIYPKMRRLGKDNVRSKRVAQYTLDGELVCIYDACEEAARITNIDQSSIVRVCNGIRKTAGNYKWKYINDYIEVKIIS